MHTGLVTLLLLTVTIRCLAPALTMLAMSYWSLRGTKPHQRPKILRALSPALRAVAGARRGAGEEGKDGPPEADSPA